VLNTGGCDVGDCRWLGFEVEVEDSRLLATCSCGWRSASARSAEEAGALADAHQLEVQA
jgi:hypothetical protein